MGMSTHVVGFKAPDEKWKKMKDVYEACVEAGIKIPREVDAFFEGESPDEAGVMVDIEKSGVVQEWNGESQDGYMVDLVLLRTKYPDLTHIRFYNSY